MTIKFQSRLTAIDWIANYTQDEGSFEVLREQLNYNFIYNGKYTVNLPAQIHEVALLRKSNDSTI